jgi:hypothetical protein
VHWTLEILARFQAFFNAFSFFTSDGVPPSAPAPVTQTVSPFLQKEISSMSMKMGIQKRQWAILFLLLLLPLLLNAAAIQQVIGTKGMLQLLSGIYQPPDPNLPFASLSEILSGILPIIIFLGFIIWLAIFVSNTTFFQKQWLIARISETLLVGLFVAKVFEIATGFVMPLTWLPQFIDSLGLPGSVFASNWSCWFIFPATAIILFVALMFSKITSLESKDIDKTVNAL